MSVITVESMTAAMEKAVELRGADWVYPRDNLDWMDGSSCVYVTTAGAPACIVGVALDILGIDMKNRSNGSASEVLMTLDTLVSDEAPGELAAALDRAQLAQDTGQTWGEALMAYKGTLGVK